MLGQGGVIRSLSSNFVWLLVSFTKSGFSGYFFYISNPKKVKMLKCRSNEVRRGQLTLGKVRQGQVRSGVVRKGQEGPFEIRQRTAEVDEVRQCQISTAEVDDVRLGQIRTDEVDEVRQCQIRTAEFDVQTISDKDS